MVFHNKKSNRKPKYSWKLNNSLLSNGLVRDEIKTHIKDFLEFKKNEGSTCQNLWETIEAVLRGKFIAQSTSIKILKSSYTAA